MAEEDDPVVRDIWAKAEKMTTARSRQLARSWSMDLPPPDDSGEIAVGVKGQRTILFVRPTGALNEAEEPMWIAAIRSEEHTSELQSLMRISYAVFCLKKKKKETTD